MPRTQWPLVGGRPVIEVVITLAATSQAVVRTLLADTGAGAAQAGFDVLLQEDDCLRCGGIPSRLVRLGGAYAGRYSAYFLRLQIPSLAFDHQVHAVGVQKTPRGLGGIAWFSFLNRFTYGNFGDPTRFGLES